MDAAESRQVLSRGDIFILEKTPIDKEILDSDLDKLEVLTAMFDRDAIIMKLEELVPSYRPARGKCRISDSAANQAGGVLEKKPVLQN